MSEILYIIGNGFDIYHGMRTKFSDFSLFVKSEDSQVYDHVNRFLAVKENWSDLELAFTTLDVENLTDYGLQYLMPYGAEDWSDAGHHDYQYEIQNAVNALSVELSDLLFQWIKQIEPPAPRDIAATELDIEKNAKFLNFNYTLTLELSYQVLAENILHIHGSVDGHPYDPLLGHSWTPEDITPKDLDYADEDMDSRVIEGNQIIKSYFAKTFKPTGSIINENKRWFGELTSIKYIYVWGHSLSEVDKPYFQEICRHIDTQSVRWLISYFSDELDSHQTFMGCLGISRDLVEYNALSEYRK